MRLIPVLILFVLLTSCQKEDARSVDEKFLVSVTVLSSWCADKEITITEKITKLETKANVNCHQTASKSEKKTNQEKLNC